MDNLAEAAKTAGETTMMRKEKTQHFQKQEGNIVLMEGDIRKARRSKFYKTAQ